MEEEHQCYDKINHGFKANFKSSKNKSSKKSCYSPLDPWIRGVSLMNEYKVEDRWTPCTVVASGQIISSIRLEDPFSVRLLDRLPLRPGSIRSNNMSKGCIGVNASRPAVIATREVHAVGSSKGDLISDSYHTPSISFTPNGKCSSKIGSNIRIDS